jgi:citrate lyase subunit beta/citryl-CoA lyase
MNAITPRRPIWRSLLYVPANVDRFIESVHTRGADAIILDLEDSVPPAEKATARGNLQDSARRVARGGADVLVRINRPLDLAVRDVEAAVSPDVGGLLISKVEGPDHVRLLAGLVDALEEQHSMDAGHTRLVVMIESARAFQHMDAIASAHPHIAALMIGGEDFALDLGMHPGPETLQYPKQQSIIAARAAGIVPLGLMATVADYSDLASVRENAERSRAFGMEGATCIHPSAVPILNEVFSPGENEVAEAKRIVEAYENAAATGRGSVEVDGRMVDVPVVLRAQRLLARADAISARDVGA